MKLAQGQQIIGFYLGLEKYTLGAVAVFLTSEGQKRIFNDVSLGMSLRSLKRGTYTRIVRVSDMVLSNGTSLRRHTVDVDLDITIKRRTRRWLDLGKDAQ